MDFSRIQQKWPQPRRLIFERNVNGEVVAAGVVEDAVLEVVGDAVLEVVVVMEGTEGMEDVDLTDVVEECPVVLMVVDSLQDVLEYHVVNLLSYLFSILN